MSAPDWIRTFASWSPVLDSDRGDAQIEAVGILRAALDDAGAVPLDVIELELSETSSAFVAPAARILRAEARAIVLRHPNPFPRIRLFSWLP